ncbi:hypothetical protein ACFWZJ_14015 [Streptomyces massasporeus]
MWTPAGAVCAVPAATVAVERVQSGAHYPSEVAVGAAIGLTGVWLIRRTKPGLALLALAGWRYTVRAMHTMLISGSQRPPGGCPAFTSGTRPGPVP